MNTEWIVYILIIFLWNFHHMEEDKSSHLTEGIPIALDFVYNVFRPQQRDKCMGI